MLSKVPPPLAISGAGNSVSSGTVVLSNANNVSFGQAGSTVTASASFGQSNPAFSADGGSSTFQTLSFRDGNGISFTNTNGSLGASYTVPTVTNSSWTVSDNATSGTVGRLAFTNLNGVTLSLSTGAGGSHTIVGSHNALTSQSTQFQAMTLGGNTAGTTTFNASNNASLFFFGGNNITLSGSGSSVTISGANAGGAQTAISSIAGSGGTQTVGMVSFINSNNLTFGMSTGANTGTMTASWALNVSATGGTSNALSGLTFKDSQGVSFGLSTGAGVGTITASVAAQTNQTVGLYGSSQTTGSASSGTYDARSITFIGAGIVSVGDHSTSAGGTTTGFIISATQSNQAFSAQGGSSAFQTLAFTNSNNVSFSNTGGSVWGSYALNVSAPGGTSNALSGITFSNSNGVSFGLSTGAGVGTMTASVAAQSNQSAIKGLGASNTGNTAGNTGLSTGIDWVVAGSNNITISESTVGGGPNTLWVSGPTVGGAQTGISGIQVSNTTYTSGTVTLQNANGISFGSSGANGVSASYTVPTITSWTVSDSVTSATVGRLAFTASNGLTLTLSTSNNGNHTVIGSYTVPTQTNQTIGFYGSSQTTGSASSGTMDARSVSIIGAGIISVGMHSTSVGGTTTGLIISASTSQSNQSAIKGLGVSNTGNTAGNTGLSTGIDWVIAASNNITASQSTTPGGPNTIWISGATVAGQPINFSAGTTSGNLGSVVFSNSNGISFGLNGSTITATGNLSVFGSGNTSGSSSGTPGFGGITLQADTGGAISVNANNSGFTLSVPQTSSLSATGAFSISTNGSTISMGVQPMDLYAVGNTFGTSSGTADLRTVSISAGSGLQVAASNSGWVIGQKLMSWLEPFPGELKATAAVNAGGSLSHAVAFMVPYPLSFSFLRIPFNLTTSSTTLATTAASLSASVSVVTTYNAVIYSLASGANSRSLSSVASGSVSNGMLNSISVAANGTQYSVTQSFVGAAEGVYFTSSTQYSISNTNYSLSTAVFPNFTGTKFLDINFTGSLAPGPYWLVFGAATGSSTNSTGISAGSNANIGLSQLYGDTASSVLWGIMGSTNNFSGFQVGVGIFSTAGGGTTNSLPISAISSRVSHFRPYFQLGMSA
jgi:hypothetical protein